MIATLFGLISGIITGMGMGGGAILVLLLTSFLGLDQHIAQSINLFFFISTSISAILINIKKRNIDYKVAIKTVLFGIVGAIIGAILAQKIDSNMLKKCFSIFILLIAIHEFYDLYKEYGNKENKP